PSLASSWRYALNSLLVLARTFRLLLDSRLGLGFLGCFVSGFVSRFVRRFLTCLLLPGGLLRRHQRRQHRRHRTHCRTRQIARRGLHRRTRRFYRRRRVRRRTLPSSPPAIPTPTPDARTITTIAAVAPAVAQVAPRFRIGQQIPPLGEIQNFALVQPRLDADHPVRGVRFGETVIDVGAQGVQRKLPLQIPFAARDFRAVQTAAHAHLDALAAEAQRRIHRFAHRPPEGHALFQLQSDRFAHQLRVQLRLVHFLYVDEDLTLGLL